MKSTTLQDFQNISTNSTNTDCNTDKTTNIETELFNLPTLENTALRSLARELSRTEVTNLIGALNEEGDILSLIYEATNDEELINNRHCLVRLQT